MGRDIAKIEALQRLDLEDLNNIQNFVTEYLNAALGGLFGYTRGLLTPPNLTTPSANNLRLSAFQVAISSAGESDDYVANESNVKSDVKLEVVRFNPSDEGHRFKATGVPEEFMVNGVITYNGEANGSFLCVSADDVDQDSANRVFWNIASGAETTSATNTTTRRRLYFTWRQSVGDIADNEAPILTLVNNATGQCRLISAWDDYRTWEFLNESTGNWHDYTSLIGVSDLLDVNIRPNTTSPPPEGASGDPETGELSYTRDLGLNMLLAYTRSRLRRLVSDGSTDDGSVSETEWHTQPALSLAGLKYAFDNQLKRRYSAIITITKDAANTTVTSSIDQQFGGITGVTHQVVQINHRASVGGHTHTLLLTLTKNAGAVNFTFLSSSIHFQLLNDKYQENNLMLANLEAGFHFQPYQYLANDAVVFNGDTSFRFAVAPTNPDYFHFFDANNNISGELRFQVTISGTPAP